MRQMPIQRQTVPRRTLDERATLLLPQWSHDWIERFMVRLQSLRPDLLPGDTLEIAIHVHGHASALEPEQAAKFVARERVTTLRDQLSG